MDTNFQEQFDKAIQEYSTRNQYGVSKIPDHRHNGSDSNQVSESSISFTDIITNNASTLRHGYLPKLSGTATTFLNGTGVFSTVNQSKFGGTGVDGALTITSGTTTIDVGAGPGSSTGLKILNYTSISITGTGVLAFTNSGTSGTLIILKCQGNVTITSSATRAIDARGLGGIGGTGGAVSTSGTDGTTGSFILDSSLLHGGGAGIYTGVNNTGGGIAGAIFSEPLGLYTLYSGLNTIWRNGIFLACGSGGGGGSGGHSPSSNANAGTGGDGGKGGAAIYIECGGAWNFSAAATIDISPTVGSVGQTKTLGATGDAEGGGGGGGGSVGMFLCLYSTLIDDSGTYSNISAAGGAGGAATFTGAAAGGAGYGGSAGGGGGLFTVGGIGGAMQGIADQPGRNGTAGSAGSGSGGGGGAYRGTAGTSAGGTAGGGGGNFTNLMLTTQNTEF